LIPEIQRDTKTLKEYLETGYKRKKFSNIILVAEGDETGGAFSIAKEAQEEFKEYDMRVTVLGHIQRGGSPSAFDRVIASQMGVAAVEAVLDNQNSIMVGMMNREIVHIPFNRTVKHHKDINRRLLEIIDILSI
jgi:6-phosphofructokinase 1